MSQHFVMPKFSASTAKKMAVVFGVALALSVSGFTAHTDEVMHIAGPNAVPNRPLLRVIAFGSSSTQGVGASGPSAAYPAQLQAILMRLMPKGRSVEVLNRGIGGQDVDDMMQRLQADVIAPKPDVVIWQTGSNDVLRHVPIDRFESKTREGIKAMQRAGAEVILMEPQWCPMLDKVGSADAFQKSIRRIGQELKVAVIRRSDMMHKWVTEGRMTRTQMLSADGLHMSDGGYAELARDIAPEVLKASSLASLTPASIQTR